MRIAGLRCTTTKRAIRFAALVMAWLSISLTSQAETLTEKKALKGNKALDLPAAACSFEGVFKQRKTLAGSVEALESSGEYFYHCEYGVIWASQQPAPEVLVLRNSGQSYLVQGQGLKKMSSRSGKFISRLLIGLMGGDATMIEQQFNIAKDVAQVEQGLENGLSTDSPHSKKLVLTPKKRQLKRAIKAIEFIATPEQVSSKPSANIRITDRNDQVTEIEAIQSQQYSDASSALDSCLASAVVKSHQSDDNLNSSIEKSEVDVTSILCSTLLGSQAKIQ